MNEKTAYPLILGIETSCDETAAAIVAGDKTILANIVLSQLEEHTPFAGVVPEIAARAHMEHLERVVAQALARAGVGFADLSAIAVTAGPGLIGGVIVGVMAAQAYASVHGLPLLPINHLEGHALTVRLTQEVAFPYLLVLVSGGHCQILAVEKVGHYVKLGGTKDDALGEAFDKTAKMLGLGFPGGPALERTAQQGSRTRFAFPRPLRGQVGCDFSFSGLKTAVRLAVTALVASGGVSEQDKADIAASFQQTVVEVLEDRITNALEIFQARYPHAESPTLVLSGGVAANQAIRSALIALCAAQGVQFVAPPVSLCTDNAAMIAWAGMERFQIGWRHDAIIDPRARWPLEEATV